MSRLFYNRNPTFSELFGILGIIFRMLLCQPRKISLSIDDTLVEKQGTKFSARSKLFDHAAHNGSHYLDGHCFVSVMLHVP